MNNVVTALALLFLIRSTSFLQAYNGRDVVTTPVPSFLIESSSFLQATWTPINSRMGSKFGQMETWTVELAALECLENLHRLIMGEML